MSCNAERNAPGKGSTRRTLGRRNYMAHAASLGRGLGLSKRRVRKTGGCALSAWEGELDCLLGTPGGLRDGTYIDLTGAPVFAAPWQLRLRKDWRKEWGGQGSSPVPYDRAWRDRQQRIPATTREKPTQLMAEDHVCNEDAALVHALRNLFSSGLVALHSPGEADSSTVEASAGYAMSCVGRC